jgi:asparagine synthase (glutamine-hydrolysing)
MLTKVDRASMSCGLEVRVPLLDHRVVEYSALIPESLKYNNGCGKYILKKLLSRYLPKTLYDRPKMGFGVPIEQWLRYELKDMMLDYLSHDRLKKEGLFSSEFVKQKIEDHLNNKANHQHRIWSLLMWEMWRERWL